jgi:hypothetical protein
MPGFSKCVSGRLVETHMRNVKTSSSHMGFQGGEEAGLIACKTYENNRFIHMT